MIRLLAWTALLTLIASAEAAGDVMIHDAWVREPPPGTNAAAYLTIHNASDSAVRVVSASSPAAARVEIHETVVEDDVARMKPVASLEVRCYRFETHRTRFGVARAALCADLGSGGQKHFHGCVGNRFSLEGSTDCSSGQGD